MLTLTAPKPVPLNRKYRKWLLDRAADNRRVREALIERCAHDPVFFLDSFAWQMNPTKKGRASVAPFILYPFQERTLTDRPETTGRRGVLWCYEHNRSGVMEKSRRTGASWFFLLVQTCLGISHPYFQSLNISKSADAVDDASPNSLFWKIRFINRHLPEWLRGPVTQRKMYIGYDRTESVLTGEASTGRAGVGGRAGLILVDECSKIREMAEIRHRTANTADCRFFNSTHEGSGTEFYRITKTPEFVKWCWHWSEHPEYSKGLYRFHPERPYADQIEVLDKVNPPPVDYSFVRSELPLGGPYPGIRSPWYDKVSAEIGNARAIAIELDIDVGGSVEQFFNVALINKLTTETACDPFWVGDVLVYPDGTSRLVPQDSGPLKLWVVPDMDGRLKKAGYVMGGDVAAGTGATPSVLSIAEKFPREKVAEYSNAHISPERFAPVANALGRLFCDHSGREAKFGWDASGSVGQAFTKAFMRLGYANVRYHPGKMSLGGIVEDTDKPGIYLNSNEAKATVLMEYASALERRAFVNRSEKALLECLQFRWADGQVVHATEANPVDDSGARLTHADHVVADAIANMLCGPWSPPKREAPKPETQRLGGWEWRRNMLLQQDRDSAEEWV